MTDATLAGRPADAVDHVMAGHAGGLVDEQDAGQVGLARALRSRVLPAGQQRQEQRHQAVDVAREGESRRRAMSAAAEMRGDRAHVGAGLGAQVHADLIGVLPQQDRRVDPADDADRVGEVLGLLGQHVEFGEVGVA